MAYQRWFKTVRDQQGNAINGASCTVYGVGTSTLATVYDPNSDDASPSPQANPFTTTSNGRFGFMAADGEYDVQISGGNGATQQYRVRLSSAKTSDLEAQWQADDAVVAADAAAATALVRSDLSAVVPVSLFNYLDATKRGAFVAGTNPDITAELQTALDDLNIGQSLYIPNGSGVISGPVYIAKAVNIIGSGPLGTPGSYAEQYQLHLADDTSGFRFDPSYAGAAVNPFAQPNVDNYGCNFIGLRISGGKASIPIAAASNQVAIKLTVGVDVTIRNCVFRTCGTAISVNSTYAAKILDNHYINCGYCIRLDPDFAAAGHTTSGATDYYQANILNIERNYISGAVYGIYLFGPAHGINILGNTIEDCTSVGIVVSSYNGSLATASTDLSVSNDTTQIRGNYFERNATAIQWGSAAGGLSQAASAPKGVICTGNFYTLQAPQIYNLSVYAATASEYRHNRFNAYLTATPDVIFQAGATVTLSHIECSVSWSGSPATDTSTVVRRYTSTYRNWSTFYVDGVSASKVTIAALQTYNAGTSGVPFDSLTTLQAWLKSVLRSEKVFAPEVSTVSISVDVKNGTYAEKISFDGCGLASVTLTPNAAATADGVSFTGLVVSEPYSLSVSGGGKIVLDHDYNEVTPTSCIGGKVFLSTVKIRLAAAGVTNTKGIYAGINGEWTLTAVTNYDANLPKYGLYASGGYIRKTSSVPSGAAALEFIDNGGRIAFAEFRRSGTASNWDSYNATGALIDTPISFLNTAGGLMSLGRQTAFPAFAVASLPSAASNTYARCFVTDANATTFNSIVAGGGANKVPVWSNGTNWLIG